MLVLYLIILNVAVYVVIGWLTFGGYEDAIGTFVNALVVLLKRVFLSTLMRWIMETDDEDDMDHLIPLLIFLVSCVSLTAGEYWLLTTYVWPDA